MSFVGYMVEYNQKLGRVQRVTYQSIDITEYNNF